MRNIMISPKSNESSFREVKNKKNPISSKKCTGITKSIK